MITLLDPLLSPDQLARIDAHLADATFEDGRLTTGDKIKALKQNQQLAPGKAHKAINPMLSNALAQNTLFTRAAHPKKMDSFLISKTETGGYYDAHMDRPLMRRPGHLLRTDVSVTIFLSDPEEYDGGELVIQGPSSETSFKLARGSAIVYPSTSLHRVAPVSRGMRLVAVTWVQSLIADASEREILFDLSTCRENVSARGGPQSEIDLLNKSIANLLRKWMDV